MILDFKKLKNDENWEIIYFSQNFTNYSSNYSNFVKIYVDRMRTIYINLKNPNVIEKIKKNRKFVKELSEEIEKRLAALPPLVE